MPGHVFSLLLYNRILGVPFLDDKNINLEIVKAGFAGAYKGNPPVGFDPSPYRKKRRKPLQAGAACGLWVINIQALKGGGKSWGANVHGS
jgi:hypothetical protein